MIIKSFPQQKVLMKMEISFGLMVQIFLLFLSIILQNMK